MPKFPLFSLRSGIPTTRKQNTTATRSRVREPLGTLIVLRQSFERVLEQWNIAGTSHERTYRSQIFQRLLVDTILFECGLAIFNHIVHDQAVHVAL